MMDENKVVAESTELSYLVMSKSEILTYEMVNRVCNNFCDYEQIKNI